MCASRKTPPPGPPALPSVARPPVRLVRRPPAVQARLAPAQAPKVAAPAVYWPQRGAGAVQPSRPVAPQMVVPAPRIVQPAFRGVVQLNGFVVTFGDDDVDHVLQDHVRLSEQESWNTGKGVFNVNWLFTVNADQKTALRQIANAVVHGGDGAPTENSYDPSSYDFYLNFNKKTGWQTVDNRLNIRWYKGVVVRCRRDDDLITVTTMFPKGWLN